MVAAIIPAAGQARRMGTPKLLLPFGSSTVLGATCQALLQGGVERLVVVTSPGDSAVVEIATAMGARTAVNPAPERGMLSSVWEGLEALGGAPALAAAGTTLLVCPGDLPRLLAATVSKVLGVMGGATPPLLARPVYGGRDGRHGHPIAIAAALVAEIPALSLSVGLRQLHERHAADSIEIPVEDPGAVEDIDTWSDYRALRD